MKTEPNYPRRPGYNTADLLMKLVMSLLLLALVMKATSCEGYPIAIKVQGEYGTYSYSAKRGVEIQVNATK